MDRLADERICRHVNHGFDLVLFERLPQQFGVRQIALNKLGAGYYSPPVPFVETIVDDCRVTVFDQLFGYDTADKAGPSGDENAHDFSILDVKEASDPKAFVMLARPYIDCGLKKTEGRRQ